MVRVLTVLSLRALLIQKDVKRYKLTGFTAAGLRALLIQKDVKHRSGPPVAAAGLRALLIQKDVKPTWQDVQTLYV